MRTLAIETATEACSVALFEDDKLLDFRHEVLGRGHAERLVPFIASLPDKGRAHRIVVSLGPGSFTGVRIGIAAARALGVAWQAEVLGYPTLTLVAAMARQNYPGEQAIVTMTGGHGEWFCQPFSSSGEAQAGLASMPPEEAVAQFSIKLAAGSKADEFIAKRQSGIALAILPDARALVHLPQSAITQYLQPLYGRPPDAKPSKP